MNTPSAAPRSGFLSVLDLRRLLRLALLLALASAVAIPLIVPLAAGSAQAGHGAAKAEKSCILLVAFGSSMDEAQASFDNIDRKVRAAFPDTDVRWAYTSRIIRKKLAARGRVIPSPAEALATLLDEGYTRVAVQSLHTIPGQEYGDLERTIEAFRRMPEGFARLTLGRPLLSSTEDLERVADLLITLAPKQRKAEQALVFMGHGTEHPANVYYEAMAARLAHLDGRAFLGTVEGYPTLEDVARQLDAAKIKQAYLLPFMSVAGDHARNDMAGDEDDSWKSVLTKRGVACTPVLKGTAEYDAVVDVWLDHLSVAVEALR
ncbi:MAG: sirohydrochlorin cobaltochelatase [Desulfovibrionaceae bacterium]|jgi:sirohydrochlorin cobaltochelatase|nr:sirohydrochlorin cobaltochelatase [Desulfovibrionaceae bacterium]